MADRRKAEFRDRTKAFASRVIRLFCSLPKGRTEAQILGKQLLRSGTSVAANYREASRARSEAEFIAKVDQCAQEADESILWLELLRDDCSICSDDLDWLLKESDELIAIFVTMSKNVKARLSTAPPHGSPTNPTAVLRSQVSAFPFPVSGFRFPVSGFRFPVSSLLLGFNSMFWT
jgi:four helix bundle protein